MEYHLHRFLYQPFLKLLISSQSRLFPNNQIYHIFMFLKYVFPLQIIQRIQFYDHYCLYQQLGVAFLELPLATTSNEQSLSSQTSVSAIIEHTIVVTDHQNIKQHTVFRLGALMDLCGCLHLLLCIVISCY